jgi:hypothetical protein
MCEHNDGAEFFQILDVTLGSINSLALASSLPPEKIFSFFSYNPLKIFRR